jgi:hypothetical protein
VNKIKCLGSCKNSYDVEDGISILLPKKLEAFKQTMHQIGRRLDLFVSLPLASLSKMALENSARDLAKK